MLAEQWIQQAIRRPGALRKKAKKAGAMTKKGTISREWLHEQAKKGDRTGQQARLAMTLSRLLRRRKK